MTWCGLPASTREATDSIYTGYAPLTPKFAQVDCATNTTDTQIVAGVAAKKIRVLAIVLSMSAATATCQVCSKPAGAHSHISGLFYATTSGTVVLPYNPLGWFQTVAGEALSIFTGAGAGTTGATVVYVEV